MPFLSCGWARFYNLVADQVCIALRGSSKILGALSSNIEAAASFVACFDRFLDLDIADFLTLLLLLLLLPLVVLAFGVAKMSSEKRE